MDKEAIEKLIYSASESEVASYLKACTDPEDLYIYAFNYNWGGGFELPKLIINNPVCTISTAKLIFWRADGINYLRNKTSEEVFPEWRLFISLLYNRIKERDFQTDNFQFNVPLTKVQEFKLKKALLPEDLLFLENSAGKNLDIEI